jgi:hypothetical protein
MLKGPGTVWRECLLKECSVVTFGADSSTKSAAMSENENMEIEVEDIKNHKEVSMDLTKLKTEHPELYAQIVAEGKVIAEQAFTATKAALDAKILELTAEKEKFAADNKDIAARILGLEKEAILRKEAGIKMSADTLFADKLKGTTIPARLIPKIKKQINHENFVKDDKLDATAFAAAIDAELKDWAPVEGESAVLGMSFSAPSGNDSSKDAMVTRMLSHVGQA